MITNKKINSEIKPNFWENIKHTPSFALVFFGILIFMKVVYDLSEGANIFGDKNTSFFDAWSIEHIITGMSLSYFFLLFKGPFSKAMKKDNELEITKLRQENKYSSEQIKDIADILEAKNHKMKIIHHSLVVICVAYAWEVVELYMETAHFKDYGIERFFLTAQGWFSGVELFLNRFFVDVFLVYLGWFFIRHKPVLSNIAAPISLFWLLTHIIVFKDSMFLHKYGFYKIIDTFISANTLYVLIITIIFSYVMSRFKNNLKNLSEEI